MTLAKYRKRLGKSLKRQHGLPHLLAFRLGKLAFFDGCSIEDILLHRRVKAEAVLAQHGFCAVERLSSFPEDRQNPILGVRFERCTFPVHCFSVTGETETCIGFQEFPRYDEETFLAFLREKAEGSEAGEFYLQYRVNGCKGYLSLT